MSAVAEDEEAVSGWNADGGALLAERSLPSSPSIIRSTYMPEETGDDGDNLSIVTVEIGTTPEFDVEGRASATGMYELVRTPQTDSPTRTAQLKQASLSNAQPSVAVMSIQLPDELGEMVLMAPHVSECLYPTSVHVDHQLPDCCVKGLGSAFNTIRVSSRCEHVCGWVRGQHKGCHACVMHHA
jgi:hypothetical protein